MPLCIALAVREMHMTPGRGAARRDRGRRRALCGATTSACSRPGTRADLVAARRAVLHAPRVPAGFAPRERRVEGWTAGVSARALSGVRVPLAGSAARGVVERAGGTLSLHRKPAVLHDDRRGAQMIKVAVWGTGMMGQGLLGFILDRPKDIELVGVIVTNPAKEGRTVGELLGRPCDVRMTTDFDVGARRRSPTSSASARRASCTRSPTRSSRAVKAGANVICIAEKLAYPWASDPEWAERFDALAKEHGVSILGTGVNPGLHPRRAHRHVDLDQPARRPHRGAARERPLAVRPHGHEDAGRRHDRRGVRARRGRRHASSATSASPSRST